MRLVSAALLWGTLINYEIPKMHKVKDTANKGTILPNEAVHRIANKSGSR